MHARGHVHVGGQVCAGGQARAGGRVCDQPQETQQCHACRLTGDSACRHVHADRRLGPFQVLWAELSAGPHRSVACLTSNDVRMCPREVLAASQARAAKAWLDVRSRPQAGAFRNSRNVLIPFWPRGLAPAAALLTVIGLQADYLPHLSTWNAGCMAPESKYSCSGWLIASPSGRMICWARSECISQGRARGRACSTRQGRIKSGR